MSKIYALPIPILDASHLRVYRNGNLLTLNTDYTVSSDKTRITLLSYTTGDSITFRRITSLTNEELTVFEDGESVDASQINNLATKVRYVVEDADVILDSDGARAANNLADLDSVAEARTNLDVYSKGAVDSLLQTKAPIEEDLSGLTSKAQARTYLGVYSKAELDALLDAEPPIEDLPESSRLIWQLECRLELDSGYDLVLNPVNGGWVTTMQERFELATPLTYTLATPITNTTYYINLQKSGSSLFLGQTTSAPTFDTSTGLWGYDSYPNFKPLVGVVRTGASSIIDVRSAQNQGVKVYTYSTDSTENVILVRENDLVEYNVQFSVSDCTADQVLTATLGTAEDTYTFIDGGSTNNGFHFVSVTTSGSNNLNLFPEFSVDTGSVTVSDINVTATRYARNSDTNTGSGYTVNESNLTIKEVIPLRFFGWYEDTRALGWDDGVWRY